MDVQQIIEALLGNGPFGIVCAVLLYRDLQRDKCDKEREIRREAIEEKRIESDKALAAAMTLLGERVK